MSLLAIDALRVRYRRGSTAVTILDGVALTVAAGEALALVGESGSGKSQTALAVMGLLPSEAGIDGSMRYDGIELIGLGRAAYDAVRGRQIGMIFQDPMSSLNPYLRIGVQLAEGPMRHLGLSASEAERESLHLLDAVRIAAPRRCLGQFPHELSGGMRQRVMIAMAIACRPRLLIADEPTTALDVTVQAEVLDVLGALRRDLGLGVLLITHDLGIVAQHCERVAVLYAGRVIESGPVGAVLTRPLHPYTAALLAARPSLHGERPRRLPMMPGQPPDPARRAAGCAFSPRCAWAIDDCRKDAPLLRNRMPARACACWRADGSGDRLHDRADDRRDAPL